jgi:predicted DNA-binding protein (UPF0251 family)
MARPHKERTVRYQPKVRLYKPQGIPREFLQTLVLTVDQLEALRLADHEGASHDSGAVKLGVSRATFGRILEAARRTVAEALLQGKALVIEGGTYSLASEQSFYCLRCRCKHTSVQKSGVAPRCPRESRKRAHRTAASERFR